MAERAMKTKCKRGHDLTDPANVVTKGDGRQCRPCKKAAQAAARARRRGSDVPLPRGIQRDDCEVDGCGRPRKASGKGMRSRYCLTHLNRRKAHGDVFADVPIERFNNRPLARRRAELAAS